MVLTVLLLMIVLLSGGIAVAVSLGTITYVLSEFFSPFPLINALGQVAWSASSDFILTAVPMFILMGELLLLSGVSQDMYRALGKWLSWLPGGLMHSNIASCAMFAATSGSSVATAATIGTMSVPLIREKQYSPSLFLGTLAAGGTLGILIPPSIPMIVYAVVSESSVVLLYLAALIPGILLASSFSLVVLGLCVARPELSGKKERFVWRDAVHELRFLVPPIGLFLIVVGSIYVGFTTPTEAASLGLIASLILAASRRRLNWDVLATACIRTMAVTGMIGLIVIAAFILNFVLVSTGFTTKVTAVVQMWELSPLQLIILIVAFYLFLGCFMETLTMVVATTPIVLPIITHAGYDPIWFGVVFTILLEAAMITPPVGINLYVIQTVRGPGPIMDVIRGSVPLLAAMIILIGLLIAFPSIALWLPHLYSDLRM
ncbi:TRAP transporter large permease [Microvirga massiliensis]|uniref:TRAP transporter large permease n=1 Tax=Microvirga massiliensis TaxID=1033741 RepID=UPI00062B3607|nr:TRAP transporter large permease [Microvirga massiliensis]